MPTTSSCAWWASIAPTPAPSRSCTSARCSLMRQLTSVPLFEMAAVPLISGLGYDGRSSPLTRIDNVVSFEETYSPSRIDRLDRQRMAGIRANLAPGYALADGMKAVQQAVAELGLPPGYSTRVMGRARELERTLQEFVWTCVLSFVLMYIVLAAQYEHLIHPITILLSLPIAVPFGLLSLWIGGETLNLYSALGILVLFGMVKKASILQIDHINQLRAAGLPRDAGDPRKATATACGRSS